MHRLGALSPDEFLFHPAAHARTELVRGRVQMMSPVNAVHGLVTMNVGRLLASTGVLRGGDVVPGFECDVRELFEGLSAL